MPKRLLFFGNERLATGVTTEAPSLQALVDAGYEVSAVIIAQNQPAKSRKAREIEIAARASQLRIPVIAPDRLREARDELAAFEAEAAVLVAFGKIVPAEIIDLFPRGIINIHPSLLPQHRGPTPIESVILMNQKETGVSLMQLSPKMDAGPVYAQETVLLRGNETKQQLADQLLCLGRDMLIQYLPQILSGHLQPAEQNDMAATYDRLITKADGELQFVDKPAAELEREVRAFAGWPRSRCRIGTTEVVVTAVHVVEASGTAGTLWLSGTEIGMHCKQAVLVFDRLIPAGRKEMPAAAFLAGYKPL